MLAVDKPPGWMLVPSDWSQTIWNLQAWREQAVARTQARRPDLWPRRKVGNTLTVAMADAGDEALRRELGRGTGLKIRPALASAV